MYPIVMKYISNMRLALYTALISCLVLTFNAQAFAATSFIWRTENEDPQLYKDFRDYFREELQPDDQEKVRPIVPYKHKYISMIGSFRNVFIVMIGYRKEETDPKEFDHFRAFFYDRAAQRKAEIQPSDVYYQWSLLKEAFIDPSPTPDIFFKYNNCLECEKEELLSSFRLNENANRWERRIWPDSDPHLLIGSDMQYGNGLWSYDCLYRIADINSDRFMDIAIRCREQGETTGKTTDELLIYTVRDGVPKKIKVQDRKYFRKISRILCRGKSSPLCKSPRPHKRR